MVIILELLLAGFNCKSGLILLDNFIVGGTSILVFFKAKETWIVTRNITEPSWLWKGTHMYLIEEIYGCTVMSIMQQESTIIIILHFS